MTGGYITLPAKWSEHISEVVFGDNKTLEVEYDNAEKILNDIIVSGKLIVSEKSSFREGIEFSPMIFIALRLNDNSGLFSILNMGYISINATGNLLKIEFIGG